MQAFPQSLAPTFARQVCGKSFRNSSVEQERLLRRLFQNGKGWDELHEKGLSRGRLKICFHKFPNNKDLLAAWIRAVRRDVGRHSRITWHTTVARDTSRVLQGFRFSEDTRWQKNTSTYRCSFHFSMEERFS